MSMSLDDSVLHDSRMQARIGAVFGVDQPGKEHLDFVEGIISEVTADARVVAQIQNALNSREMVLKNGDLSGAVSRLAAKPLSEGNRGVAALVLASGHHAYGLSALTELVYDVLKEGTLEGAHLVMPENTGADLNPLADEASRPGGGGYWRNVRHAKG